MTITDLDLVDQRLVIRASAHAAAESTLLPSSRFQDGVTDLDAARVLLALERGVLIVPGQSQAGRWALPDRNKRPHPLLTMGPDKVKSVTRVVQEMIRLGLVYSLTYRSGPALYTTRLVPALVHAKGSVWRLPACGLPTTTIKRFRLVEDLALVDCQACVDAAR